MADGSWGLSLFVLFERLVSSSIALPRSWGLSLFVLFEHDRKWKRWLKCSWGLSLFVLFEHWSLNEKPCSVLED